MDMELLACPSCGSELFTFTASKRRIVFRVTTHYLALVVSEGSSSDANLVDMSNFHCGACSWSGGVRELAPSHS